MTEPTDVTFKPEAPTNPKEQETLKTEVSPPAEAPVMPDVAAWVRGADEPAIGSLFEGMDAKRFDELAQPARREEPAQRQALDDLVFNRLPEVGRLRVRYKNQELSRQRLGALRFGWLELGGKGPASWTTSDLFAAMRRIRDQGHPVSWTDFVTAARDIWRDAGQHGREQLQALSGTLARMGK